MSRFEVFYASHCCYTECKEAFGYSLEDYLDLLGSANMLMGFEVKSGRVKNTGGSLKFKQRYPEALSLIIGSVNLGLEEFLMGEKPIFL